MIALIAAVSRNGVIGKDGKIPWHISEDLKRFKQLTMGHVLIMGRKTYESIGRPLPGRETIMLTRSGRVPRIHAENVLSAAAFAAPSLDVALGRLPGDLRTTFICGGAAVYREVVQRDLVDRCYLTDIDADFEGDTTIFLPAFRQNMWHCLEDERHEPTNDFPHAWSFRTYERHTEHVPRKK